MTRRPASIAGGRSDADMTRTLVVIGNGMVGHRLVDALSGSSWRIVVFGEESRPAYDRVALSSYVDTWSSADLELAPLSGAEIRLGEKAVSVDRERRIVVGASGVEVSYDALVLATGSVPFVPPVPGR